MAGRSRLRAALEAGTAACDAHDGGGGGGAMQLCVGVGVARVLCGVAVQS